MMTPEQRTKAITSLKRKLSASAGQVGYADRVRAIEAEIARLEVEQADETQPPEKEDEE